MAIDAIRLDIPGSTMRVGIADQFDDYAIRRHLVTGEVDQADAEDALHTLLGGSWNEHHIIPNLPLRHETITKFGLNKWVIVQVFQRDQTSPWYDANGKRQELRFTLGSTKCFISADASRTNGLPYVADPDPDDFYMLPLLARNDGAGVTVGQSPALSPIAYDYERPAARLRDERTYDVYPVTSSQIALLGKVNNASITLNSVGLSFSANEVRFVGADFVMKSNGSGSGGRWAGAYLFDTIKGGHYMQRAYWDDANSKWKVANVLMHETGNFAAAF